MKKLIIALLLSMTILPNVSHASDNAGDEPYHTFFLVPHPDDELLSMGTSIISHNFHSGNNGNTNIVHLVLLTGGEHSASYEEVNGDRTCSIHGHKHDPVEEGYAPFDREKFKEGKVKNFRHVAAMLGITPERQHIYDLGDGDVTVDEVKRIITDLSEKYPRNKFKSMSYHDNHPDHANSGKALIELYNEGLVTDARFYAKNSLVHSGEWDELTDTRIYPAPYEPKWDAYLKAAMRSYEDWNPRKGYYHAGYVSVEDSFEILENDPRTWYHLPNK